MKTKKLLKAIYDVQRELEENAIHFGNPDKSLVEGFNLLSDLVDEHTTLSVVLVDRTYSSPILKKDAIALKDKLEAVNMDVQVLDINVIEGSYNYTVNEWTESHEYAPNGDYGFTEHKEVDTFDYFVENNRKANTNDNLDYYIEFTNCSVKELISDLVDTAFDNEEEGNDIVRSGEFTIVEISDVRDTVRCLVLWLKLLRVKDII